MTHVFNKLLCLNDYVGGNCPLVEAERGEFPGVLKLLNRLEEHFVSFKFAQEQIPTVVK